MRFLFSPEWAPKCALRCFLRADETLGLNFIVRLFQCLE